MEETSVFWVDLRYRLRSRKMVPLRGSRGVTDTPSCLFLFLLYMLLDLLYMLLDYHAVGPGSAPGVWAVVPGMYGTHLKHEQCLQPRFKDSAESETNRPSRIHLSPLRDESESRLSRPIRPRIGVDSVDSIL